MDDKRWRVRLAIGLVAASAVLYSVHFLIFRDTRHIFIYLLGDIAFLPLQVLLVTMILNELLERRSKEELMEKLDMVIDAFFAETGTDLLGKFASFDTSLDAVRNKLVPTPEWKTGDFARAQAAVRAHHFDIDITAGDLEGLKRFLAAQRPFLLQLLQNQNLLEHETFTDTLWAVFHVADELTHRRSLEGLPASDLAHLAGDIGRAYAALAAQWIGHLDHLRMHYPYLYSLAVRTNPLDPQARVEVTA
ncbi:MAG: hypothetical protein LLG24_01365 [Actinomycetia bacterium]|nr:hypothetical protein [Actinomycetes bacterium]